MKVVVAAFGLLGLSGCVRAGESMVRERAVEEFACAHYALTVTEVGPDVYRASGCGQEVIYACQATRPTVGREPDDVGDQAVLSCARTPE